MQERRTQEEGKYLFRLSMSSTFEKIELISSTDNYMQSNNSKKGEKMKCGHDKDTILSV